MALRTGRPQQMHEPGAIGTALGGALGSAIPPPPSPSVAFARWLESSTSSDHEFLQRMGWRCDGQLAYLADELDAKGEVVSAEALHDEGLAQGVRLLKTGHNPYYRNTLLSPFADRDWLLASDSKRLAAATNPPCMLNPNAPAEWTMSQWKAMLAQHEIEPLFNWDKVIDQFDRVAYERDGYCAFEGIMTEETRGKCQRLNDQLIQVCIENDEFCIKNDEFCIKNDEFCIKNEEFCIKNEETYL